MKTIDLLGEPFEVLYFRDRRIIGRKRCYELVSFDTLRDYDQEQLRGQLPTKIAKCWIVNPDHASAPDDVPPAQLPIVTTASIMAAHDGFKSKTLAVWPLLAIAKELHWLVPGVAAFQATFETGLPRYLRDVALVMDETKAWLDLQEASVPPEVDDYVLRREGDRWLFREKDVGNQSYEHMGGLAFVRELLYNAGRGYPPVELGQIVAKSCPEPQSGEGLGANANVRHSLLDQRSIKEIEAKIAELKKEFEAADQNRREEIEDWVINLQERLKKDTYKGRSKAFSSPVEAERVRITRAIKRAIARIMSDFPDSHLKASIKTGNTFVYTGNRRWT